MKDMTTAEDAQAQASTTTATANGAGLAPSTEGDRVSRGGGRGAQELTGAEALAAVAAHKQTVICAAAGYQAGAAVGAGRDSGSGSGSGAGRTGTHVQVLLQCSGLERQRHPQAPLMPHCHVLEERRQRAHSGCCFYTARRGATRHARSSSLTGVDCSDRGSDAGCQAGQERRARGGGEGGGRVAEPGWLRGEGSGGGRADRCCCCWGGVLRQQGGRCREVGEEGRRLWARGRVGVRLLRCFERGGVELRLQVVSRLRP